MPFSLRLFKAGVALALCLGTLGSALMFIGIEPAGATVPAITKVVPASGLPTGGTVVTITGTSLGTTATATVNFGTGNTATPTSDTGLKIVVTTPAAPSSCASTFPCTIDITVTTTTGGTSPTTENDKFTYEDVPTVTQVVSGSAPTTGGNTIIIVGTNLLGPLGAGGDVGATCSTVCTGVKFSSANAVSYTVESSTEIVAVTPALPSGDTAGTSPNLYHLTVTTGAGTSATSTDNEFYWFGGGSCSFGGTGVNNSGGPPGSSAYILDVPNSVQSTTGVISSGSPTLTDSSADFTTTDIGLGIVVSGGGGAGNSLISTITAVNSTTSITMAANARATETTSYAFGGYATTGCTGLSGLGLTTPFIESLSSPEASVVTGTCPGGCGGNETWLGWSGANAYSGDSGSTYTAPGAGFVFPYGGPSTTGGCPLSAALCNTAATAGTPPYYATDPSATCPPSQAQANAGLVDCSVGTLVADEGGDTFIASTLAIQYANAPTPASPTATLTGNSNVTAGNTVTITGGSNWWGAGPEGSPGYIGGIGATGVASAIPAPTVWVGSTRASAVQATSNITITPATYACTGGGAYLSQATANSNPASCTLGQGSISGTFTAPSSPGCTTCNVYIDEPNLTLTQGEYSGTGSYNVNTSTFTYDLFNAVESTPSSLTYTGGGGPSVTGVSPATGPAVGGTPVAIAGTNFTAPCTVNFGGIAATDVVVNSPISISATSPAGTSTVDVTADCSNGNSSPNPPGDQFTYAPTVTGVAPSTGPGGGGTTVTITGTGFTGATAVAFGIDPGRVVLGDELDHDQCRLPCRHGHGRRPGDDLSWPECGELPSGQLHLCAGTHGDEPQPNDRSGQWRHHGDHHRHRLHRRHRGGLRHDRG